MRRKKGIGWMIAIPFVIVVLVIVIRVNEPVGDGITRAAAYKAAALSLTTAETCRAEAETEKSRFTASEQRQWYVKYMDYLYRREMITEELSPAVAASAERSLTYREAAYLAGKFAEALGASSDASGAGGAVGESTAADGNAGSPENGGTGGVRPAYANLAEMVPLTEKNAREPYPEDAWWKLYEAICRAVEERADGASFAALGPESGGVCEAVLQIEGTPDNTEDAAPWNAFTDQGICGFEGLGLTRYIDCRIRVLMKGQELIRVLELVSEETVYPNVWIVRASKNAIVGFTGDFTREFPVEKELEGAEDMADVLADLWLSAGKVERISLKREKITAKVLAVRDDAIELEGYGLVETDTNFCVYKTYDGFERQSLQQILVGSDGMEFVVAGGKLCVALIVQSPGAERIRVLVMDTGFQSVFHSQVCLEFLSDGVMRQGEKETVYHAGESLTLMPNDGQTDGGRIIFRPSDEAAGIRVAGLKRGQGIPVYPGRLEIACESEGLVIVNELYLEDYLKRVLPGEMPLSYEPEALKAQAVCARTYACRQMRGNAYRQYGAHVDDSTNFQVYNNGETGSAAAEAVDATYGQLLMYGDNVAEAFYFSTSCGHTTDMSAWGQDAQLTPYLSSVAVRPGGGSTEEESSEEAFAAFIRGDGGGDGEDDQPEGSLVSLNGSGAADGKDRDVKKEDASDYEADYAMYRWNTQISAALLQENISGIGTITQVEITRRSPGGAAQCMKVTGTSGSKEITGESRIRAALGHSSLQITRNNGTTASGFASLPSAFIAVERTGQDKNGEALFSIWGGGYGHGIGMSQNGAQAMAKRGMGYEEILDFFYKGTTIEKAY